MLTAVFALIYLFFQTVWEKTENRSRWSTWQNRKFRNQGRVAVRGWQCVRLSRPLRSAPKKRASSLLLSLLGPAFINDTSEPAVQSKTADASAEEEMDLYCRSPAVPLSEDPLDWWHRHKGTFPLLSRLAKRYMCIPGTSVSAERVFSTAGDVITAKRSALKPDHVDQLVFLHKNLEIPKC